MLKNIRSLTLNLIEVSNLAIYNKKSKKADKINIEIKKDKKIRVFKSDGKEIKWALQF